MARPPETQVKSMIQLPINGRHRPLSRKHSWQWPHDAAGRRAGAGRIDHWPANLHLRSTHGLWSAGPTKLYGDSNNHESWTKLPDGSILSLRRQQQSAARPAARSATMTWIDSGAVPVSLEAGIGAGPNMGPEFCWPTGACCSWGDPATRRSTLRRRHLAARERGLPDQSSRVVWKLVVRPARTLAISPDPRLQRSAEWPRAVCRRETGRRWSNELLRIRPSGAAGDFAC